MWLLTPMVHSSSSVLALILKVHVVPTVGPRSVAVFDLTHHGSFISERRLVSH